MIAAVRIIRRWLCDGGRSIALVTCLAAAVLGNGLAIGTHVAAICSGAIMLLGLYAAIHGLVTAAHGLRAEDKLLDAIIALERKRRSQAAAAATVPAPNGDRWN